MTIDDSTTKNTRLLDREFIPKTEHLDLIFFVQWFPLATSFGK